MLTRQEYINFLVANGIPASQASSQAESIYGQGQSVASGLASGFQGGGAQVAQGTPSLDDYINNPFLSGTGGLTAPTDPRPANWDTQIFGGGGPQPETLPSLDDILKLVDWDGIFSANSAPQVLSGSKPVPQPESQPRYRPDDTGVGIRNPTVLSGSKPDPQPESNPTYRPDDTGVGIRNPVDPNNPQTNGGTMPQTQQGAQINRNPDGGYTILYPDGSTSIISPNGETVNVPASTGGNDNTTNGGGSNPDQTGGLFGFLGQLLGLFGGSQQQPGSSNAQQSQGQGQNQTATGGNSTATGGNSTNTNTTGASTATVGDLSTGPSNATVGNVGSNVNLSDILGDVSNTVDLGGAVTVGPSTQNVNTQGTVGDIQGSTANVNTANTIAADAFKGMFGDIGGLDTSGMFAQGAVTGGEGGAVTLNKDAINLKDAVNIGPGAVRGGDNTIEKGAVDIRDLVGDISTANTIAADAFKGMFGDIGGLDTSGMFAQGAVAGGAGGEGGSLTLNKDAINLKDAVNIGPGAVQGGDNTIESGAFSNMIGADAFRNMIGDISTQGTVGDISTTGTVGDVSASVNTDGLGNAISSIFAGGGLLDNIIGGGANYAAGEAYKNANKETLDFIKDNTIKNLDPFRTMGTNQIPNLEKEIGNPVMNDVRAGQQSLTAPTAVKTDVNQINPFDANDPALKYLIDQGTRAVENSRAASGKANSGGTLEALQELGQGAALNRAGELTRIGNMRDQASLARDQQYFGQQLGNLEGGMRINDQLYSQLYDQNNQNLAFDQNAFNQLAGIVGMGQNAAAGQGDNANAQAGNINSLLRDNVTTRGAQGYGLYDMLKGIF